MPNLTQMAGALKPVQQAPIEQSNKVETVTKKDVSNEIKKEEDGGTKKAIKVNSDDNKEKIVKTKRVKRYELDRNIKCNGVIYKKGHEFNGFDGNFNVFKNFITK